MKKLICVILSACFLAFACQAETLIANPWIDTTAEELVQALGVSFGEPDGAEEILYRMLESENLAEMQFVLQGANCTARIKPAAEWEDISGLYFDWDSEESCEIGWCEGKILRAAGVDIQLCLWFDIAPGLMYSLSIETSGGEATDIPKLAGMVYLPAQGEVG